MKQVTFERIHHQGGCVILPEYYNGISVVIVNYNTGRHLLEAVRSVLKSDHLVREVVVVDNASTDDSIWLLLHRLTDSRLRVLRQSRNLGFARGCNVGFQATTSHQVLFLNPDCRLEPGALPVLHATLSRNPACGMVGPLLLNPNGTEQRGSRRELPTPFRFFIAATGLYRLSKRFTWCRNFNLSGDPLPASPVEIPAISGACMLIRRKLFEQLHGFDTRFFFNFEDLDLCLRSRNLGRAIVFEPHARVIHVRGVSRRANPRFAHVHTHISCIKYFNKHFSGWMSLWSVSLLYASVVLSFLLLFPLPLSKISSGQKSTCSNRDDTFVLAGRLGNFER